MRVSPTGPTRGTATNGGRPPWPAQYQGSCHEVPSEQTPWLMGGCAQESSSGTVQNFPEFASFRESSRCKALKTRGFALLSEGSRAPFSGKFPDGGPNGTRWRLLWYWACLR